MTSKTSFPQTRAKTPIGILRFVARLILEEPKRYNQSRWLMTRTLTPWVDAEAFPACGTICCIGGWALLVTGHAIPLHKICEGRMTVPDAEAVTKQACLLLGVSPHTSLFADTVIDRNCFEPSGTVGYARAGVAHIRRFVKKTWGKTL